MTIAAAPHRFGCGEADAIGNAHRSRRPEVLRVVGYFLIYGQG
jgi:hypothetical protein